MASDVLDNKTDLGNYFISNYPPYSVWCAEHVPAALEVLAAPPPDDTPLGLYLHIPFCRKRCRFCYFRVYTDKNAQQVDTYVDALAREVALYAQRPGIGERQFEFVYFGGGTPSFLSSDQLTRLIDRIREYWSWDDAREVTFECEPGTLKKHKLETIKQIGVTRLSLGVEHLDDAVLELNGRAHNSAEIHRAYEWARTVDFQQINIDLIAGMLGDTEDNWKRTVEQAVALAPDSVTIYQMELPFNTVFSKDARQGGDVPPVADWPTKRRWVDHAFDQFMAAGYEVSSAYTLIKPERHAGFVYRDSLWHGADLIGTGVASFSHFQGVHYQNADGWGDYVAACHDGRLPISRAYPMNDRQRLIREFILQMKLGRQDLGYFRRKFGVEINEAFAAGLQSLVDDCYATVDGDQLHLNRDGLLRADGLLPRFFEPEFQNIRYT